MIVLPLSSQVRYTVSNQDYTCYTPDENRDIAILIIKGERDNKQYSNCDKTLQAVTKEFNDLKTYSRTIDSIADDCVTSYTELQQCYNQVSKERKLFKNILIGSAIGNILLITILIF